MSEREPKKVSAAVKECREQIALNLVTQAGMITGEADQEQKLAEWIEVNSLKINEIVDEEIAKEFDDNPEATILKVKNLLYQ